MAQHFVRFKGLIDNSEQLEDNESIKRKAESIYRIELVNEEEAVKNFIKKVLDKSAYTAALVALKLQFFTPDELNKFLKNDVTPEEKAKIVRYMAYITFLQKSEHA